MPRKPKSLAERLTGIPDRRVRERRQPTPIPQGGAAEAHLQTQRMPTLAVEPPDDPGAQMVTVTLFRGGPEDWDHQLPPLHAAVTPARATWVVFTRVPPGDGLPVAVKILGPELVFEILERGTYSAWFRNERGAPLIAMALGACDPGDRVTLGDE